MKTILLVAALLGLAGCGTTIEACYVHPEYGQVCVTFDGKLHVRADIKGARLTEVMEWLRGQGVNVDDSLD